MSRLTEKSPYGKGYIGVGRNDREHYCADDIVEDLAEKMGPIEDLEEELGIDLITFFKALKYGVCVKDQSGQVYRTPVRLYWNNLAKNEFDLSLSFRTEEGIILRFGDYGKTWALTMEELE